jgi:DNA topoisomerase-1
VTKREKERKWAGKRRACKRMHRCMGDIYERVDRQLGYQSMTKRRACAAAVGVMLRTMIRVGNEESVEEHDTFGITTMFAEHVQVDGDAVRFVFTGKSSVPWDVSVTHPGIAATISALLSSPLDGRVFWYEENGERKLLYDRDVRDWLGSFKVRPKDIRTYTANKLMHAALKRREAEGLSKSAARAQVREAFEEVAGHLNHLPSTCRANYVLPETWEGYVESGGEVGVAFFE